MIDRRENPRYATAVHGPVRGTLRPGCAVLLIDVGPGGTLVEASRPMRPGSVVHLQFTTEGRTIAINGRVLRCAVWSIDLRDGVRYRGALKFDRPLDL